MRKRAYTEDALEIVTYDITNENASRELLIALVADLHSKPCEDVLDALRQQKPDMICVAGDLLERFTPDKNDPVDRANADRLPLSRKLAFRVIACVDTLYGIFTGHGNERADDTLAYGFLREAVTIAPVFYGLGNHERYLHASDRAAIRKTGAVLLDNAYVKRRLAYQEVLIGGLCSRTDMRFLDRFYVARSGTGAPPVKVLLCHHPEYFARYLSGRGEALVLSGHAHGGQWRFRGRGVYAPGQGLFPKYTEGVYHGGAGGTMIVSRGLANTAHLPRVNNPRQLVFIRVRP